MALERELWLPLIREGLFPDNSFISKSVNLSGFVNGKKVHVPNAGGAPKVVKNRATFPANVTTRRDTDLDFDIDEYTSDPIKISDKEKIELSYDKRQSVIRLSKNKLIDTVAEDVLLTWFKGCENVLITSGKPDKPHVGNLDRVIKRVSRADILALCTQMNINDIPSDGRYLLLDAVMYNQLLEDLTEADKGLLNSTADASQGVVGKLFGFNLMMRSRTVKYDKEVFKPFSQISSGDMGAGLAWQVDCVAVAQGDVKMFDLENDPTYYGDIFSFLVRAGGSHLNADKKGVYSLVQALADENK